MIMAELKYALSHEWVKTPEDFLFRRTYYGYLYANQFELIKAITNQFYQLTSQTPPDINQKVNQMLKKVQVNHDS